jgi:hypothetical protein
MTVASFKFFFPHEIIGALPAQVAVDDDPPAKCAKRLWEKLEELNWHSMWTMTSDDHDLEHSHSPAIFVSVKRNDSLWSPS